MEGKFTASCEEWIDRARIIVLRFWNPKAAYFYRDSAELRHPTANYYPTATFACVAALERYDAVFALKKSDVQYDGIRFLHNLRERGLESVISRSTINPKTQTWNVYTACLAIRALLRLFISVQRRLINGELAKDDWEKLATWLSANITREVNRVSAHLAEYHGAALPGGRVHPFLTFFAYETVDYPIQLGLGRAIPKGLKRRLSEAAVAECRDIISNYSLKASSPADLVALLFNASLLNELDPVRYGPIAAHSLSIVCGAQAHAGGWPMGRSLVYAPGGNGVQISSFDIGAHVASLAVKMSATISNKGPVEFDVSAVDSALRSLFSLLIASLVSTTGAKGVEGWCNDRAYAHPVVEAWTSAIVLTFLLRLREYGFIRIRQRLSGKYSTVWPPEMQSWIEWQNIREADPDRPILQFIDQHFVQPHRDWMRRGTASGKSMILFGPPGTSKTTIVKAMARQLDWPLITVTPGVFLARGIDAIDAQASAVFSDFQELDEVVLLFDECDELFRKRPDTSEGAQELSLAALITGAMLPRIQDLHDRGRLIFVIATNRLDAIDPAVKRQGRVDYVLPVGPPELAARTELLKSHAPAIKGDVEAIAAVMERFTRLEVVAVAKSLNKIVIQRPRTAVAQLIKQVRKIMPDEQLTIEKHTWERFLIQRNNYPVPSF